MYNYFASFGIGASLLILAFEKILGQSYIDGSFMFSASIAAYLLVLADFSQFLVEKKAELKHKKENSVLSGILVLISVVTVITLPWTAFIKNHATTLAPFGDAFALGGLGFTIIFMSVKDVIGKFTIEGKTVKERDYFKAEAERFRLELERFSKVYNIPTLLDVEIATTVEKIDVDE